MLIQLYSQDSIHSSKINELQIYQKKMKFVNMMLNEKSESENYIIHDITYMIPQN